MTAHKDSTCFQAPFRLIHPDFDGQNMIFTEDGNGPPQLSGIIDWEYTYTGPLYELYEYPIFIIDNLFESKLRGRHAAKTSFCLGFTTTIPQEFF